jgi:hypothetical protein
MAEDDNKIYDLIAATGCPTGIAHTYMAKKKRWRMLRPLKA